MIGRLTKQTIHKAIGTGVLVGLSAVLFACQSVNHTNQAGDKTHVAQIRTQMAGQFILSGRLDDAKRQLDMAMIADERFAPSYDMMGVLLQTEGSERNLARADEFFRTAIRLDTNFMRAYNNYGVYLVQVGRVQEAVSYFEQAGGSLGYEGRVQALENLGFAWQMLGDESGAKSAFNRAVLGGSVNLLVYEYLLDDDIKHHRVNEAMRLFDRLLADVSWQALTPKLLAVGIELSKYSFSQATNQPNRPTATQLKQLLISKYPDSEAAHRLLTD